VCVSEGVGVGSVLPCPSPVAATPRAPTTPAARTRLEGEQAPAVAEGAFGRYHQRGHAAGGRAAWMCAWMYACVDPFRKYSRASDLVSVLLLVLLISASVLAKATKSGNAWVRPPLCSPLLHPVHHAHLLLPLLVVLG